MKKELIKFDIDTEIFKKLKKHKRVIYLQLDDGKIELENNSKVLITNKETKKQVVTKVKRVYRQNNIQELKNILKRRTKYIIPKNYDEVYSEDKKVIAIEFKSKNNIFRKILLGILIIMLVVFGIYFINKMMTEINDKKVNAAINSLEKDKTNYVFIEINPSLVLVTKNNKVEDVACLNSDCMSFYNEIDVKGKTINDSVDSLYNLSKEKGFDVSNGVKIKTTNELEIDVKDYVTIEYIDDITKNELLSKVENNEDIKSYNNNDYYLKLWEELKKDKDYDKVYSCSMNNKELECYFIMSALETGINSDKDYNTSSTEAYDRLMSIFSGYKSKVYNTFSKFNIELKNSKAYINGIGFSVVPVFTLNNIPYKNVLTAEIIDILPNEVCRMGFAPYKDGECKVNDGIYLIPLENINLLNPNSSLNNMITHRYGVTDNALRQYEMTKELEG